MSSSEEEGWMNLVTDWQCLYLMAIGMSDAQILERYADELSPEHIQTLRDAHEEMVAPT